MSCYITALSTCLYSLHNVAGLVATPPPPPMLYLLHILDHDSKLESLQWWHVTIYRQKSIVRRHMTSSKLNWRKFGR